MQRLTKRNIKVINHDTGQQIDFPTFGKEAGEDAYNQVSNQLTSLQAQLESSIASMSEAIVTDKTLTIEDAPADAKATGDALDVIRTATATDVGKALKVKTVTSGKVSEWEFGAVESNAFGDPAEFSTGFYWHRAVVGTSTESQLNKSTNAVGKCAKITLPKGSVLRITSTEPNTDTLSRIYFAYNADTGICIDIPTKNASDTYATYYLRYDVDANVYINTKASNTVFACVADIVNPISDIANLVGTSRQSVIDLNGAEKISYSLKSMKRPQYKATNTPTVFLHFSDIHGDGENLKRIVEFAKEPVVSAQVDDVICSGDVVFFDLTDGMSFFTTVDGSEAIMIAPGNHDVTTTCGAHPYQAPRRASARWLSGLRQYKCDN